MRELANAVAKFFEDSDVVLLGAPLSGLFGVVTDHSGAHPPDTHYTQCLHRAGYRIGDVVSDLLEHPHSDMAAGTAFSLSLSTCQEA